MLKSLLRNTSLYAFSLYLLPHVIPGVKIVGGFMTLLIGGFMLTLMFLILKPIFSFLTFPFNMISLGLVSTLTNALILYLLTVFVPNIAVTAFRFAGVSLAGFTIPAMSFNTLFAFILAAITLSIISGGIRWMIS